MLSNVYIVLGFWQWYEDYEQWIVAVYYNKEKANEHCDLANKFTKENYCNNKNFNPYDPGMHSREEPSYFVTESVLIRHVDEFLENAK